MSMISLTLSVSVSAAKKGAIVDIFTDKIIGITSMPLAGSVVIGAGGATVPVEESKEQILALITKAKKEASNG